MSFNQYDLNNLSLVKTGGLAEQYIPLWFYSGSYTAISFMAFYLIGKGTTSNSIATNTPSSQYKLHTLSPNWNSNQKFALEASFYTSNASYSCSVILYDVTSGTPTQVSASQINNTNTSMTVLRSGQFTLTPGHTYGVGISQSNSSATVYLTKASLVAFIGG